MIYFCPIHWREFADLKDAHDSRMIDGGSRALVNFTAAQTVKAAVVSNCPFGPISTHFDDWTKSRDVCAESQHFG